MPVLDTYSRPLRSLRISVTDRCNLRCEYCMPAEEYVWLRREELLTYEETAALASIFALLGVEKLRLTGGEPLLRRDLDHLVTQLASIPGIRDLALTTNGLLLAGCAADLRRAGLRRITISLDTLRPDRFRGLTRRDSLDQVLAGIAAAGEASFESIKLNSVIMRGTNDDELADLLQFARAHSAEVRFIEYMDVGGALHWSPKQVVARDEMLERIAAVFGPVAPIPAADPSAPADRYRLPDGTTFGIIASVSQPFCGTCDRARLTADGVWFLCLYARQGLDLKRMMRAGVPPEEIAAQIHEVWHARRDRGAEERLAVPDRTPLFQIEELRSDPHREMHTRGG